MAVITFDPQSQRIILSGTSYSAAEIYSRWVDWVATADNTKYLPAFRNVGGDDLGDSLLIPPYFFLLNGWRIRPAEANQVLTITGNLFVDEGGDPIVPTLGSYNVLVKTVVPVQAQAFATGGSTGITEEGIANSVWEHSFVKYLLTIPKYLGLK